MFAENPKKRKGEDNTIRGFKKIRLEKKLKKKYQNQEEKGNKGHRQEKFQKGQQYRDGKSNKRDKFQTRQNPRSKKVFGGKFNKSGNNFNKNKGQMKSKNKSNNKGKNKK